MHTLRLCSENNVHAHMVSWTKKLMLKRGAKVELILFRGGGGGGGGAVAMSLGSKTSISPHNHQ